eukprot:538627_1
MSSQSLGDHEEVEYGFNFDEWIIDNDLKPVKQLLIHHKATTLSALKFNAAEFQSVLTDTQLLTKIHMLPKLTNAVHTISKIVVADYNSDQERMNDEDIESEDHDASPPPQKAIPRSYSSGKKTIPDLEPDEPR